MINRIKNSFKLQRFFVGEGPLPTPYVLTQRRLYILPTKQGFVFALMLFVMLLGSINYSNSLGYLLTFLLTSLSVVTIFHTYNNLLKLSFGPAICHSVFAGENTSFSVQVNNQHHAARFSVITYSRQKIKNLSDITENSISTLTVRHQFDQRGNIPLPRFTIESRFPFGLFRTWALIQFDQTQLVYPKPSSHTSLPIKLSGLSAGTKQVLTGNDDFKGLRNFIEGDSLQHIHWKNFARHNTLQTKEFSAASSDELWINYSDTTLKGIEPKLSQLCRWLLIAEEHHLIYGLRLPNFSLPPLSGKVHLNACLKQLALFDASK